MATCRSRTGFWGSLPAAFTTGRRDPYGRAGRPIGLHPDTVQELGKEGIHLHFYGDFTHGQWKQWIERARVLAPRHFHLHANVSQDRWLAEFSQYDAGWLHFFRSENFSEIRRSSWDDLNIPARLATLAVSGVPQLQGDNTGSIVATQTVVKRLDTGLLFKDMHDLGEQIRDARRLAEVQENTWRQRHLFMFDHHAPALVDFFRQVIASCLPGNLDRNSSRCRSTQGTASAIASLTDLPTGLSCAKRSVMLRWGMRLPLKVPS